MTLDLRKNAELLENVTQILEESSEKLIAYLLSPDSDCYPNQGLETIEEDSTLEINPDSYYQSCHSNESSDSFQSDSDMEYYSGEQLIQDMVSTEMVSNLNANMKRILYTIVECSEGSRSERSLSCSFHSDSDNIPDDWKDSDCIPTDWRDSESETGQSKPIKVLTVTNEDAVSSSDDNTMMETVYCNTNDDFDSLTSIPENPLDEKCAYEEQGKILTTTEIISEEKSFKSVKNDKGVKHKGTSKN